MDSGAIDGVTANEREAHVWEAEVGDGSSNMPSLWPVGSSQIGTQFCGSINLQTFHVRRTPCVAFQTFGDFEYFT